MLLHRLSIKMWLRDFKTALAKNRAHATTHHRPIISVVTKEGVPRTLPVLLSRIHTQHGGRIVLVLYGWDTGFLDLNMKRQETYAEVCWYMPKTREQWRLQGTARFLCNATTADNTNSFAQANWKDFWKNEVQWVAGSSCLLQRCVQLLGAPTDLCPEAVYRPSTLTKLNSQGTIHGTRQRGVQLGTTLDASKSAVKKQQLLQGLCAVVCLATSVECLQLKSPQSRTCWTYQNTSVAHNDCSHVFCMNDVALSSLQTNLPATDDEQCHIILQDTMTAGDQGGECCGKWSCVELNP